MKKLFVRTKLGSKKSKKNQIDREAPTQAKIQNNEASPSNKKSFSDIVRYCPGATVGYCSGCLDHIGKILQRWKNGQNNLNANTVVTCLFHQSFEELNNCARTCITCRVWRQALLMGQTSLPDYEQLLASQNVMATLINASATQTGWAQLFIDISVEAADGIWEPKNAMLVGCTTSRKLAFDPLDQPAVFGSVIKQISPWLRDCQAQHKGQCGELHLGKHNPTRLIEVVEPGKLRLAEGRLLQRGIPYIALSYSWGNQSGSNTTTENIEQRMRGFPASDLLATQRDAVELARLIGVSYIWIDAVCIIQAGDDGKDWDGEASRMHEYYGNALFTLCISSGTHADEGFSTYREGWRYKQLQCDIDGVKLNQSDLTLDEARASCPLNKRGWTLQEEFLSPRRVYWFRECIFWSCSQTHRSEYATHDTRRRHNDALSPRQQTTDTDLLGRFLIACYKRRRQEWSTIWLSIVESYSRRILTNASDKYKAISGVAARRWTAKDTYVAGLWSENFAQELAWKLRTAKRRSDHRPDAVKTKATPLTAPSWSWMSLPSESALDFARESFEPAAHFAPSIDGTDGTDGSRSKVDANQHIEEGSRITSVKVQGRVRSFWSASFQLVQWNDIASPVVGPALLGATEEVSFGMFRSVDAYSVSVENGRIAAAEKFTEEIIGQLDYLEDAKSISSEGQIEIECLEVGRSAMIFIQKLKGGLRYRRIGACHQVREDFFEDSAVLSITLV